VSFYTTLSFYRPTKPPTLTGADLAAFVSAFATLGVSDPKAGATFGFEVRFGDSIDQDDQPADWLDPVLEGPSGGGIYTIDSIDYDTEAGDLRSLDELSGALATLEQRPIYRATLTLGQIVRPILDSLRREPSEDNPLGLGLDTWSFEVGPIVTYNLASEEPFHVGWIAVQASGPGYLYPWTFRELIGRADAIPQVQELIGLCRRTWPVVPGRLARRIVKARKAMGDLWPYARLDRAWDWYWGLQESG
jgi:hypothetical protein